MGTLLNTRTAISVKEANKNLVLSLIRTEQEMTRVELAHRIQVSRSAISAIVGELVREGWVIESGEGKSGGGRKPVLLEFNPRARYLLGIDVGYTHISAVVTDLYPRVIASTVHPFDLSAGQDVGMGAILSTAWAALSQAGVDSSRLVEVSVGIPEGLYTPKRAQARIVDWSGWKEASLSNRLHKAFKAPVVLENGTSLAALGEWYYGAGRGSKDLAYIKVGTNISFTILRGGKIQHLSAGMEEFAHRVLEESGPLCRCGRRGCLETLASGGAIIERALEAIRAGHPTHLSAILAWKGGLAVHDIIDAARMGDSLSRISLINAGKYTGVAIAKLASIYRFNKVLIGGGVAQAGESFLAPMRKSLRQELGHNPRFEIVPASLGGLSCALGAIALACQNIFVNPAEETAGYGIY